MFVTHSIGMRQEVDAPPPPGESGWRFIPWGPKLQDKASRTVKREAGPCPDHLVLILEVRRPLQYTSQKGSLEAQGEWWVMLSYPQASAVESLLAKRPCAHSGGSWDTPNTGCEPGKAKGSTQGKPGVSHESNSNHLEGATQTRRLPVFTRTYYTPSPLGMLLDPYVLGGNSFPRIRRARALVAEPRSSSQRLVPSPLQTGLSLWAGAQAPS